MNVAQLNIGRLKAPTDDPVVAGFMDALEPINALADEAPGFVWRLQTEEGDATSIKLFDDELIIINFSVWDSVEHLRGYVYKTAHRDYLKRRLEWFERQVEAHLVLWWVEENVIPTIEEAMSRLDYLRKNGPDQHAFTFGTVPELA